MANMKYLDGPLKPQTLTKMKSDSDLLSPDIILDGLLRKKVLLADDINHNLVPTDADSVTDAEKVALPTRFTLPAEERAASNIGASEREAELDVAIQWLRQEIFQMKSEDRVLMKQFMSLSNTISEIKEATKNMDLASSCHSLDLWAESSMASGSWSPMSERDFFVDFQSDSVPCSPMVDRDIIADFRGLTSSPGVPRRSGLPLWIRSGNKEEFV